jgi:hypothetical protein
VIVENVLKNFNPIEADESFLVDKNWTSSWLNFINGKQDKPPGVIINDSLSKLQIASMDLKNLEMKRQSTKDLMKNAFAVSRKCWVFFKETYGGGPPILENRKELFKKTTDVNVTTSHM